MDAVLQLHFDSRASELDFVDGDCAIYSIEDRRLFLFRGFSDGGVQFAHDSRIGGSPDFRLGHDEMAFVGGSGNVMDVIIFSSEGFMITGSIESVTISYLFCFWFPFI